MKLSEFKNYLLLLECPVFELWDWTFVPSHYHVTEIWLATKQFIDCWGQMRDECVVTFQLWYAHDVDHRLSAEKLLGIISLFEKKISADDYPIEIEYQGETIGKYGITWNDGRFMLISKKTDCLAKDKCGILEQNTCCGGGCC